MSGVIDERIIAIDRELKAISELIGQNRRDVITAVDPCKDAKEIVHAGLDKAFYSLSELGRQQVQARDLLERQRKLRMEA
ncbi:MAG: hypothetical protein KAV82_11805 [Phycisphaerae bacterium]|nr:hypothetical protein [Phycisphaerae bacterium]